MSPSPYRPRTKGHDYYDRGVYLITLVVRERQRLLGELNMNLRAPGVNLTVLGDIVGEEWGKTAAIQAGKGRKVRSLGQVVMPDHWHGVIIVKERMDKSLGYIIQCFKSACTARWRREITGFSASPSLARQLAHMSKERRYHYYASRPRIERPLFDDDYDDTICIDAEHLRRMIDYVTDNPRRAIIMRIMPQFFERRLHVVIDGMDYAAFGNLFLLRWATKVQVFCHRKARLHHLTPEERQQYGYTYPATPDMITRVPYEDTAAFRQEHDRWMAQVMQGATVVVTPGISKGEEAMKNECLERGFPLIHLQKEPIGPYWKPEKARFDACANGSLLILAPWHPGDMGEVNGVPSHTEYSTFHNMNRLAEQICMFDEEALCA